MNRNCIKFLPLVYIMAKLAIAYACIMRVRMSDGRVVVTRG